MKTGNDLDRKCHQGKGNQTIAMTSIITLTAVLVIGFFCWFFCFVFLVFGCCCFFLLIIIMMMMMSFAVTAVEVYDGNNDGSGCCCY